MARCSSRIRSSGIPLRDHRPLDDLAFGSLRSRRDSAAHDSPAEKAFAPEPESLVHTRGNVLARAEHEQEIGWLERRADQMQRIDRGDFGLARQ